MPTPLFDDTNITDFYDTKENHQLEVKDTNIEKRSPLHQSYFKPGFIKPRAIDGLVIKTGLAADRPDGSTWTKAYFATDTGVLSIWDGSAWKSTTLT